MYISDVLRLKLSKKLGINLSEFVWNNELSKMIFGINLNEYETLITTMNSVYEYGLNIGYCGLTSRYVATIFKDAQLAIGKCDILEGTKNSQNGEHAFILLNGSIIDTTLRITMTLEESILYGYSINKVLAYESARMFSEYELYSNEYRIREKNIETFNKSLFQV